MFDDRCPQKNRRCAGTPISEDDCEVGSTDNSDWFSQPRTFGAARRVGSYDCVSTESGEVQSSCPEFVLCQKSGTVPAPVCASPSSSFRCETLAEGRSLLDTPPHRERLPIPPCQPTGGSSEGNVIRKSHTKEKSFRHDVDWR